MASLGPNELSNEIIEIPLTHFPYDELKNDMYTNGQVPCNHLCISLAYSLLG